VGTLQWEVGQGMIESLRRQPHHVCAAAFVVSVAVPALTFSRRL
jgi:hypothetical protein